MPRTCDARGSGGGGVCGLLKIPHIPELDLQLIGKILECAFILIHCSDAHIHVFVLQLIGNMLECQSIFIHCSDAQIRRGDAASSFAMMRFVELILYTHIYTLPLGPWTRGYRQRQLQPWTGVDWWTQRRGMMGLHTSTSTSTSSTPTSTQPEVVVIGDDDEGVQPELVTATSPPLATRDVREWAGVVSATHV